MRRLCLLPYGRSGSGKGVFCRRLSDAADWYKGLRFAQPIHDALRSLDCESAAHWLRGFASRYLDDVAKLDTLCGHLAGAFAKLKWPLSSRSAEWRDAAQAAGAIIWGVCPDVMLDAMVDGLDGAQLAADFLGDFAAEQGRRDTLALISIDDMRRQAEFDRVRATLTDDWQIVAIRIVREGGALEGAQATHITERQLENIVPHLWFDNDGAESELAEAGYHLARRLLAGEELVRDEPYTLSAADFVKQSRWQVGLNAEGDNGDGGG